MEGIHPPADGTDRTYPTDFSPAPLARAIGREKRRCGAMHEQRRPSAPGPCRGGHCPRPARPRGDRAAVRLHDAAAVSRRAAERGAVSRGGAFHVLGAAAARGGLVGVPVRSPGPSARRLEVGPCGGGSGRGAGRRRRRTRIAGPPSRRRRRRISARRAAAPRWRRSGREAAWPRRSWSRRRRRNT